MDLRCSYCRNAVTVPTGLRRYFDMPVRCCHCRRIFMVSRQGPTDDAVPAHAPPHPLDRSVSARRNHHLISCHACGASLRLAGKRGDGMTMDLLCLYCMAEFRHHERAAAISPDAVILTLIVLIAAGSGVLWGQHEGYIELRNMAGTGWLEGLRQLIMDIANQLRTAAMARLV